MEPINRYLDHAVLKPDMTPEQVKEAIQLGIDYQVRTVCVHPGDISLALEMCKGTATQVICVLDFPHGRGGKETKKALAALYAKMGVAEIDMVMNYGLARGEQWDLLREEIACVVQEAHQHNVLVKVIIEASELSQEQMIKSVHACISAGADYAKSSTGFSKGGSTPEIVQTMLEAADGKIKIKPSGGIRNKKTALDYIRAGADRLGVGFTSTPVICDDPAE